MAAHDLRQDTGQIILWPPLREVRADFRQVSNVADVIADPIFILEAVPQIETHFLEGGDCLQNREAVLPSASDVVDLAAAWGLIKLKEEFGNVVTVNLVAHLFSLVANDRVLLAGQRAGDDI